jgi:DNA-binding CsgD family transcriptional regulator
MKLTTRERQLLDAAANGRPDRQIADDLNISIETVSSYWRAIRLKFQAASRTECVARYSQKKSEYLVKKHELESAELLDEIKIRTEAQADALAQRNMLAAITDASLAYIQGRNDLKKCLDSLLQDVLNLTYSEYGFIGEVLYEDGKPYLQEHALTNIAWDQITRSLYEREHAQGLEFKNLQTLFGAALTKRAVVIANEAPADPLAGGIPKGHPPLNSFIGIPIFSGTELIGLLGLANREGGYQESLVDFLKPVLTSCATFIIGSRLENERIAMLERIADSEALSRDIVAVAPTGILYETLDRTVEIVNQAFLNMFGFEGTPEEFVGRSCPELGQLIRDQFLDPQNVWQRVEELIRTHETAHGDILEFVDGRRYRREFLVLRSRGLVRGYLWRYRDITRRNFTRSEDLVDDSLVGFHI